jgi:hypothetical protein
VTVDGGEISSNSDHGIYNYSTGTVTVDGGKISSNSGLGIFNYGTVTVDGGEISSNSSNGINNGSGGIVTINGGSVSSASNNAINNTSNGTVTIEGGTISNAVTNLYAIYNAGTLTIKDGTVTNTVGDGISISGGTLTISGGTVSGKINGINYRGGSLTISGGEVNGNTYAIYIYNRTINLSGEPTLSGQTADIYLNGTSALLSFAAELIGEDIYTVATDSYRAGKKLSAEYTADNYSDKFVSADTSYHIGYNSAKQLFLQQVVTITPTAGQTKEHGENDPAFLYTQSPGVAITGALTGALSRVSGEDVGTYAYTLGDLAVSSENYYLILASLAAFFTIGAQRIAVPSISPKTYNGTLQGHGITNTAAYTISIQTGDTETAKEAGDYSVTATLTDTNKYQWADGSISPKRITWVIQPKAITVKPVNASKKVGEANPDFTLALATGSSLAGTDTIAYAAGTPAFGCLDAANNPVNANSATGTYAITITSLTEGSSNYTVTYTGAACVGTLTINQDALDTGDYTITPTGYTEGEWTDSAITVSPAGSYQTIRSVAANGDRGNWVTLLTVQDASASLTFECKTTSGDGTGAISET